MLMDEWTRAENTAYAACLDKLRKHFEFQLAQARECQRRMAIVIQNQNDELERLTDFRMERHRVVHDIHGNQSVITTVNPNVIDLTAEETELDSESESESDDLMSQLMNA